jgi:Protein of unknown function (DUF3037)
MTMHADPNPQTGYYSLVQYCPDPMQGEVANVGVLVFCPARGFLRARTADGNDRVARIFKRENIDLDYVNQLKASFERRIEAERPWIRTVDDLKHFVDSRANDVVLTPPRYVRLEDPDVGMDRLFKTLVGGRSIEARQTQLAAKPLREFFARLRLEGKRRIELRKRIDVPLLPGEEFVADWTYQNGAINLVKAVQLPPEPARVAKVARNSAFAGHLIQRHWQQDGLRSHVHIVSVGGSADNASLSAAEAVAAPLMNDLEVDFIPWAHLDNFQDRVRAEAH